MIGLTQWLWRRYQDNKQLYFLMDNAQTRHYRSIGEQLARYSREWNGELPSSPILQGIIADLAGEDYDLVLPLKALVAKPIFRELLPLARSGSGIVQRLACQQELTATFSRHYVAVIGVVLDGFLGIPDPFSRDEDENRQLTASNANTLAGNAHARLIRHFLLSLRANSRLMALLLATISGACIYIAWTELPVIRIPRCRLLNSCGQENVKQDPNIKSQPAPGKPADKAPSGTSNESSGMQAMGRNQRSETSIKNDKLVYFEQCRMGACYVSQIEGLRKLSSLTGSYYRSSYISKCGDSMGVPEGCVVGQSQIDGRRLVDCAASTINGEPVPAVARYGYEEGFPEEFKTACSALERM